MQDAVRLVMPSHRVHLSLMFAGTISNSCNGSNASGTPTTVVRAMIPSPDDAVPLQTHPLPSHHLVPPVAAPLPCTPVAHVPAGEPPSATARDRRNPTSSCRICSHSCVRCQHISRALKRSGISTSPRCVRLVTLRARSVGVFLALTRLYAMIFAF